ncbi:hypothetical protein GLN3_04770 [Geobacillus lituanicus]|uniref:FtsX-like permease family protein n=1 Tax=Geobacillus thermoleovorans TaxID=33941 RepID=UPI0005CD72EF|nr:FtsX-like permease family protein [Geobacillus thermoleovorans]ASS86490.1 hypothetical protein GLN3_04770 [Geobacillus lituanicus]QOR83299.1 FtsX-like permease family protein [Geobacillus stearothermophilus]TLS31962.1 FtsX-like permease family protein [Geobacillus thermoleovorans]
MISITWKRLYSRKWISITTLLAFISIYTLIPFGWDKSKTATTTIQKSIEQYGRGSYDLLVRPPSSRTTIERALHMVEENYIGDSKGGISIAEWKKIKEDPDVEVAAPVASLGYFRGKKVSIEFPVLNRPTRFTYQFYTSDGRKKYPLNKEKSIVYFEQPHPGMIQYITNNREQQLFSSSMSVLMPENYYLLVAIDPDSEGKLTRIDFSALKKKINNPILQDILKSYGNPPVVKVLQNRDLHIPLYLKLTVEQLDVKLPDYLTMLGLRESQWMMEASPEKIDAALSTLQKAPIQSSQTMEINLSHFQKPFDGTALALSDEFVPMLSERFVADHNTSVYYVASKLQYEHVQSVPTVNIVHHGEPPSYKKIEKKGVSMQESQDIPFLIEQVGTFSQNTSSRNRLAASPLGIYGEMKAIAEDGTILTPTTHPGSFIPSPASGVTTLDAAELIKGKKPIDAIRIKIAGITNYNEAAREKIKKVATKLLKMGYEVDVVAGSSFKEMTLRVEGIGNVKEPWTTLGVAQTLTRTWNGFHILTTILLILFAGFWLVVRFIFEQNTLARENELLSIIGWEKEKIRWRNILEQYMLTSIALIVSLFFLYQWDATPSMYAVAVLLWIFTLAAVALLWMRREKTRKRIHAYKQLASIFYYKQLIIPMMFVLCLALTLLAIHIAALGDAWQRSSTTSLGNYMNDRTNFFRLFVAIVVFYLNTISLSEGIASLFNERKQEFAMYRIIGWTKGRIAKFLFMETFAWSAWASLAGAVVSGTILCMLNISMKWICIGIGIAALMVSITLGSMIGSRLVQLSK